MELSRLADGALAQLLHHASSDLCIHVRVEAHLLITRSAGWQGK
jgi:hypothetical protein